MMGTMGTRRCVLGRLLGLQLGLLLLQQHWRACDAAAGGSAAGVSLLPVQLLANTSTRSAAVAQIDRSGVPPRTTWFHIRPTVPPPAKPDGLMHSLWRPRTPPKPAGQLPQGVQQIPFDASCEFAAGCDQSRHNYSFVVEAWSDRTDLGEPGPPGVLLAQSAPLAFHFDDRGFANGLRFTNFTATEHGPGHVTIGCLPMHGAEALYAMAELVTWFGYRVHTTPPAGLPTFTIDEVLEDGVYSTRLVSPPRVSLTLSSPGTYYVGMYGAFNGDETGGDAPHLGVRTLADFPSGETGYSTFQPFAVVVPYENGTQVPTPPGFAGPVHVMAPIPGDCRLPLRRTNVTVFTNGTLYLPLVKGPGNPVRGPHMVELELPVGVSCSPFIFTNITDVSNLPGGGAVSAGFHRVRLTNTNFDDWGYLNWDVKLKFVVAPGLLQGKMRRAFAGGRARAFTGTANQARSDNWQAWSITVVALEVVALPKRLRTNFGWDGVGEFGGAGDDSVRMWRQLGFNTVPSAGISVAPDHPGVLSPLNRTGPAWEGMKYCAGPTNGMQSFGALRLSVAAAQAVNFSALGVSPADVPAERAQLVAAAKFFANTTFMDVSYQGFFYRRNVEDVAALVNFSRPDYLAFDIETMPPFDTWVKKGFLSQNFLSRMQPGETRSAASLRIAKGWIGAVVDAARAAWPRVQPAMYTAHAIFDEGFQLTSWPMLAELGFSDEPSYYDKMNSLDRLAASTRAERLAVGNSTALLPWLSPGQTAADGGAPPEDGDPGLAMYNALLQIFTSGATGFNLYTHNGFVDMSIWLAVRDAVALVTPHEDLIMDGQPAAAADMTRLSATAVVSAMMGPDGSMLIASSTMPHNQQGTFSVRSTAPTTSGWLLCELPRAGAGAGKAVAPSADGVASWHTAREAGSLLLFGRSTPCHTERGSNAEY
jgi:hypothetical protein